MEQKAKTNRQCPFCNRNEIAPNKYRGLIVVRYIYNNRHRERNEQYYLRIPVCENCYHNQDKRNPKKMLFIGILAVLMLIGLIVGFVHRDPYSTVDIVGFIISLLVIPLSLSLLYVGLMIGDDLVEENINTEPLKSMPFAVFLRENGFVDKKYESHHVAVKDLTESFKDKEQIKQELKNSFNIEC